MRKRPLLQIWHNVFTAVLLAITVLHGTAMAQIGTTPQSEPTIEELQVEIESITDDIRQLDQEINGLSREDSQLSDRRAGLHAMAFFPRLFTSIPLLSGIFGRISTFLAQFSYFCGAFSLLFLVIWRKETARKLLSITYPFRQPLRLRGQQQEPMPPKLRLVWKIVIIVILLALALPAIAQDSLQEDIDTAIDYINLTPPQRLIKILENTPHGERIGVVLDSYTIASIQSAASKHNHPPLLDMNSSSPITVNVNKGNPEYWLILASLYEATENLEAQNALKQAIGIYVNVTREVSFSRLMNISLFLAAHDDADQLTIWLPYAFSQTDEVWQIASFVAVAQKQNLEELGITGLLSAWSRTKVDLPDFLKLVKILDALGAQSKAQEKLRELTAKADFNTLLSIASTAQQLGYLSTTTDAMTKACTKFASEEQLEELLQVARRVTAMMLVSKELREVFASNIAAATRQVTPVFPVMFDMPLEEKEKVSLSTLIAAYLYNNENPEEVRQLFEYPVSVAVRKIIESMGERPAMNINDLYVLYHYYNIAGIPDGASIAPMIKLQEDIRIASSRDEDIPNVAAHLALQMKLKELQNSLSDKRNLSRKLSNNIARMQEEIPRLMREIIFRNLAVCAQLSLLIIGLWIAFSRSLIAAKHAYSYRISNFIWTFVETVGIELCCMVTPILGGAFFPILLGQDRLKHFKLLEEEDLAATRRPPPQQTAPKT